MPYDRDSGLMYNESFTSLPQKDEDDFVYVDKPGHARARPKDKRSTKGTRTLYNMAMLKILRSLDCLYPDLLKAYPVPILEEIWKAISRRGLDGLRMWKLFAPVLASTGNGHWLVRTVVKRPQSSFDHVIRQGSSIDCAWLTNLTLDAIPLTTAQYLEVSKMPNLNSLAVISGPRQDSGFSDRVLRAWASDATAGSFKKLQHIFVSGHEYITEQSLAYLSSFEALELFCALNCQVDMSSKYNQKGHSFSKTISRDWHDSPNGPFRTFLRSMYSGFDKPDKEASFPSPFDAYISHCRHTKERLTRSKVPHLLMTLLSGPKQNDRPSQSKPAALHCFERNRQPNSNMQITRDSNAEPASQQKRRKLKSGKAKSLNDLLEGFS